MRAGRQKTDMSMKEKVGVGGGLAWQLSSATIYEEVPEPSSVGWKGKD